MRNTRAKIEENKQIIRDFFAKHRHLPSRKALDPDERELGQLIKSYTARGCTDLDFIEWVKTNTKRSSPETARQGKIEVRQFFEKNNRFPDPLSDDSEERRLAYRFGSYIGKKSRSFDPVLREWAESHGYGVEGRAYRFRMFNRQ